LLTWLRWTGIPVFNTHVMKELRVLFLVRNVTAGLISLSWTRKRWWQLGIQFNLASVLRETRRHVRRLYSDIYYIVSTIIKLLIAKRCVDKSTVTTYHKLRHFPFLLIYIY